MPARVENIQKLIPDTYQAMFALERSTRDDALPQPLQELVRIRVSQINGCGFCTDMHNRDAKKAGETDERLFAVAAWRDTTYFTDAERAALALAEAATRLADRGDAVPDEVWDAAAAEFDERALAVLVATIATINTWNRFSVTTRLIAGES